MSHIIFLHGASSSGKTSIAIQLQARVGITFWHISIDHLRDSGVLPTERFRNGDFDWANERDKFFAGFHASLKAYADAGNNLIIEHILDKDEWLQHLKEILRGHNVLFIGIHCHPDILKEREIARGDRPLGSALKDFHHIHLDKIYDLELDSTDDIERNVESIISAWKDEHRKSSFA